ATAVVASAAFVGSGVAQFKNGVWMLVGVGDLINTMITAAIAVFFILVIGERFGSLTLIILPTIVGVISGLIGITILPYVQRITTHIDVNADCACLQLSNYFANFYCGNSFSYWDKWLSCRLCFVRYRCM